jgi:hypothetical protein
MEPAKIPTLNMKTDDIAALKKQYLEKLKMTAPSMPKLKS